MMSQYSFLIEYFRQLSNMLLPFPCLLFKLAQDISKDGSVINHSGDIATHLKQGKPVVLARDTQTMTHFLHNLHK